MRPDGTTPARCAGGRTRDSDSLLAPCITTDNSADGLGGGVEAISILIILLLGDHLLADLLLHAFLIRLQALHELLLNNTEVSDAAADELGTSLANGAMAHCTRLNLNFNGLSDGACTRLARTLAAAPAARSLAKLQLNGNGHTDVTLGTLAELLHEGKLPKLAHLDVLGNGVRNGVFGDDAVRQLRSECEARADKIKLS